MAPTAPANAFFATHSTLILNSFSGTNELNHTIFCFQKAGPHPTSVSVRRFHTHRRRRALANCSATVSDRALKRLIPPNQKPDDMSWISSFAIMRAVPPGATLPDGANVDPFATIRRRLTWAGSCPRPQLSAKQPHISENEFVMVSSPHVLIRDRSIIREADSNRKQFVAHEKLVSIECPAIYRRSRRMLLLSTHTTRSCILKLFEGTF
jgi:hypothetical protein